MQRGGRGAGGAPLTLRDVCTSAPYHEIHEQPAHDRGGPPPSRPLRLRQQGLAAELADVGLGTDDLAPVTAALAQMRATGRPARWENRVPSGDGSLRWIAWTLAPEPGGRLLTGVGRDATDRRGRERKPAMAQVSLCRAQRTGASGQLTDGLARVFDNPLLAFSRWQTSDLKPIDVGLPGGMDGRQVADARVLRPGLQALSITGHAGTAAISGAASTPAWL